MKCSLKPGKLDSSNRRHHVSPGKSSDSRKLKRNARLSYSISDSWVETISSATNLPHRIEEPFQSLPVVI